jgi:peptide/nickel transport system substrate-binding protein
MNDVSRRDVLRGGAALGAAAALSVSGSRVARAQDEGSSVVIGQGIGINTLDPHQTATVGTDLSVISHLYTSLVLRGPDLELQPSLATSWEAAGDTSWVFTLRDDVVFPNGEPLDAAAVKWNIERVLDPDFNARIAGWFTLVSEVNAPDATTVEIVTSSPYPALADQLSMFFLLPPEWTAEHDPAAEALGSGPYDLVEWIRDDSVTLQAKAEWWGELPPFQTVTFAVAPENSTRVSGLLAGDYDVITNIPPTDIARINESGDATAGATASTRMAMVKMNTFKAPLDNTMVRQALNYAVDKQLLVDVLFEGLEVPLAQGQVLTEHYFGFNEALEPYPYDPDMARQLLSDAGFGDGFEAQFDVPTGTYLLGEEISQAIAGQLEEIGITVSIGEMPFSVYMDKYLTEKDLAQLAYITQAWPTIDADGLLTLFESGNQYAYWDNAEFTEALAQGRSTLDPEERLGYYEQATAIMREEAPSIFLFPQPATYAVVNSIQWTARSDDWVRAWDMQPAG